MIAEKDGKFYGSMVIDRPEGFATPFVGSSYPCLIWDHGNQFTDKDRSLVARALIESGCRYAVCAGECCQAWEDAIDIESEAKEVLDKVHVMTTSHDGESPDDVGFYFVSNTNFDQHKFHQYLVLHVGAGKARGDIDAAVKKHALSEMKT